MIPLPDSGLYAITDPELTRGRGLNACVEQVLSAGASAIQYRDKTATAAQRRERAQSLLTLCAQYKVPLIINDDVNWRRPLVPMASMWDAMTMPSFGVAPKSVTENVSAEIRGAKKSSRVKSADNNLMIRILLPPSSARNPNFARMTCHRFCSPMSTRLDLIAALWPKTNRLLLPT